MKVKVIKEFVDMKDKRLRKIGDEFEVTKERFEFLNGNIYGPFVEEINENMEGEKLNG